MASSVIAHFTANEDPLSEGGIFTGSGIKALGGVAVATSGAGGTVWTVNNTSSADCDTGCTLAARAGAGNALLLFLRDQQTTSPHDTYYRLQVRDDGFDVSTWFIQSVINGTFGSTIHTNTTGIHVGDLITFSISGNTLVGLNNGSLIVIGNDSNIPGAGHGGFTLPDASVAIDEFILGPGTFGGGGGGGGPIRARKNPSGLGTRTGSRQRL